MSSTSSGVLSSFKSFVKRRRTRNDMEGFDVQFQAEKRRMQRTRGARHFKPVAIILLAGSAAILSAVSFMLIKESEEHNFMVQYDSIAEQIIENFRSHLQDRIFSLDAFSVSVTSFAHASDMKWPMVSIPDFAIRGWIARQQMKSETIGLLPIVNQDSRQEWEEYSMENQGWLVEAQKWERDMRVDGTAQTRSLRGYENKDADFSGQSKLFDFIGNDQSYDISNTRQLPEDADFTRGVADHIYTLGTNGVPIVDDGNGPFTPIWMTSPAPLKTSTLNYNLLSHQSFWKGIESVITTRRAALSKVLNLEESRESITGTTHMQYSNEPISAFYYPVFDDFTVNRTLVGIVASEVLWKKFFDHMLPSNAHGITCVIENACNQEFTYVIDGTKATYLGPGDLHDPNYNSMEHSQRVSYFIDMPDNFAGAQLNIEHCPFTLHVYPSGLFHQGYHSVEPLIAASSIVALFLISFVVFLLHDRMSASKSNDGQSVVVLERTFPHTQVSPPLKARIMGILNRGKNEPQFKPGAEQPHFRATLRALPSMDSGSNRSDQDDPFSNATIMFADIDGFKSWGKKKSSKEKTDLTETVHRSLNVVAKRYGIFQVEMADDCFVAVTGVQDAEDEHAAIMARFACDCRKKIGEVFKSRKAKGLTLRFGIHSGHVQAGLYGDESSRFQLFGETVDTTYQMLRTGKPNRIQVSVETAELLNLAGKSDWMSARSEGVLVKGKGKMSTFWLKPKVCLAADALKKRRPSMSDSSRCSESTMDSSDTLNESRRSTSSEADASSQLQSIIDINVALLLHYVKKIQAKRRANGVFLPIRPRDEGADIGMGNPIIEEAREVVRMPAFDPQMGAVGWDTNLVEISEEVEAQLRLYVSSIASTYRDNEFHTIEHATNVTKAMDRMLKKVCKSDDEGQFVDFDGTPTSSTTISEDLDNRTFGIASDPLSQFGLMFAAFVHDVDHVGVSNHQLVKEKSPIAGLYNNKSVAEQNSVDIAWWLLMTPNFADLRQAIYSDEIEMRRLRQLLVNSVMATDILDRDLKNQRDRRWNKAFRKEPKGLTLEEHRDIQATAAIEHLMQAADVVHTIQGFRNYLKWSEKQFEEMYLAHHAGRADKDPAESWYSGELAFFDKFVIPLVIKLNDCGVFGSAGDEYLRNAKQNRKLWSEKGENIVRDIVEGFSRKVVAAQEDTILFT